MKELIVSENSFKDWCRTVGGVCADECFLFPHFCNDGIAEVNEDKIAEVDGEWCGTICVIEDEYCQVWSKMWQASSSENETEWTYFCHTRENPYNCPRLENLVLLPYDGKMWVMGGAGAGYKAFEYIFISNDHGITWKPDADLHMPSEMLGVSEPFAATVDENNYIWLFAGNQVWRGRINRLGFARS